MQPKVSVIVPVYNAEKYLRRCIDSILGQTFTDFELLLIDDGSKDSSGRICDEYAEKDGRVRVFHKENGGVSAARNLGLDNANGEWISFVDADDWVDAKLYSNILNSYDCKVIELVTYSFWTVLNGNRRLIHLPVVKNKVEFIKNQMLKGYSVVWNVLFRRDFIISKNLRFNQSMKIGEDFDFLIRSYLNSSRLEVLDYPLYYYNMDNESSALHKMDIKQYDYIINALVNITDVFKQHKLYDTYKTVLCWKILRAKQDYVLYPQLHNKFLAIYPESHNYIISCPTINMKIKIMMWLLTHRLGFFTRLICYLRYILNRKTINL